MQTKKKRERGRRRKNTMYKWKKKRVVRTMTTRMGQIKKTGMIDSTCTCRYFSSPA